MIKLKDIMPDLRSDNERLNTEVNQLQQTLKQEFPQLEDLHIYVKSNRSLFINSIRVKKEFRQKGFGRAVILRIKKFADDHKLIISLSPFAEPRYKEKLDKFYKSLGFINNKGRKKDYQLDEPFARTMYRRPGVNEGADTNEYIYHGTYDGAGYSIQKSGGMKLNSVSNNEPFISFTSGPIVANYYAKMKGGVRGIILRTLKTNDFKLSKKFKNNNGFEWVTTREIPLDELEIQTQSGWVPLKNWDFVDKQLTKENLYVVEQKIPIYRGISQVNKQYNSFYTTDKEWARQFTQSGLDREIKKEYIDSSVIYKTNPMTMATGLDADFDRDVAIAKSKGFKAIWLDEGNNEPPSIYIIDKMALI